MMMDFMDGNSPVRAVISEGLDQRKGDSVKAIEA